MLDFRTRMAFRRFVSNTAPKWRRCSPQMAGRGDCLRISTRLGLWCDRHALPGVAKVLGRRVWVEALGGICPRAWRPRSVWPPAGRGDKYLIEGRVWTPHSS